MNEDKHEIKVVRYVHHQVRQKPDGEFRFLPHHIIQDTTDYFPYESINVKTSEEVQKYFQDTISDFTKIYPDAVYDEEGCIYFLTKKSSLRVAISSVMDDEESPNMNHIYTYMYSAVYFEE